MTDQNTFMETIKNVAEIIKMSEKPMSEAEMLQYFDDMELNEEQKMLVLDYLMNPTDEEETRLLAADEGELPDGKEIEDGVENPSLQSKVFSMYLEELAFLPQYTEKEKEELYKKLLQGEEKTIETLSAVWLKKVLTIAKTYIEPKLNVEDLVQEGNMALFIKLQELCGSKAKADVEKLLEEAVEKGIMDYVSEVNGERELENTVLGKIGLVNEARKLLAEEKGQVPTIEELSEYTKIPVEELEDIEDLIQHTVGN